MNRKQFNKYWDTNYPESNPIGYKLRSDYPKRWLRIHSLPESKRYAETEEEYKIILDRQNEMISELIGDNSEIIIVTGQYEWTQTDELSTEIIEYSNFAKVKSIDLHKMYPEDYDDNDFYGVYIKSENWKTNTINEFLKNIADDKFRAMFVCPKMNCIVAPYDGGMDIIVGSQEKRDELKVKYKNWLSEREDGM